jgi:drug/metabolite transporter (DMT)-like permease
VHISETNRGTILAVLSGISAGVTVVIGKMAAAKVSSLVYVLLLSFISGLIAAVLQLIQKRKIEVVPEGALTSFYGHVMCSFMAIWSFWEGTRFLEAQVASFSVRIELAFVLLFSWLWFKERFSRWEWFGAIMIVVGTAVLGVNLQAIHAGLLSEVFSRGGLLMLASGVSFGGAEIFANQISKASHGRMSSSSLVVWRSLSLSGLYAVCVVMQNTEVHVSWDDLAQISAAALLGPFFARIFFMEALPKIGLGRSSLISQVEPVVTSLVAYYALSESVTAVEWWGSAIILVGTVFIFFRPEKGQTV